MAGPPLTRASRLIAHSSRATENILVTTNADLIAAYERQFAKMWADDKAFQFVKS